MQPVRKPVSIIRVVLMWVLMIAAIVSMTAYFVWRSLNDTSHAASEKGPDVVHSAFLFVLGALGLVVGIAGYVATISTCCFTFEFDRPVWYRLRSKIFLANIIVPLIPAIGLGCIASAIVSPMLGARGLSGGMGGFVPYIAPIVLLQIAQLWFMIWSPLERRFIFKRLAALGITREQIESAFLVGLSNPGATITQRMGTIETDMGALWVGPAQLIFWGDAEQFAFHRGQITLIEQKMDNRSNSALGGIAHVILHVQPDAGPPRQIRLHTEGELTLGGKKRQMERSAEQIGAWHSTPVMPPPIPT